MFRRDLEKMRFRNNSTRFDNWARVTVFWTGPDAFTRQPPQLPLIPFLVSSFDSITGKPGLDIRKGITHPSPRFMIRDPGSIKSMPAQCFYTKVY